MNEFCYVILNLILLFVLLFRKGFMRVYREKDFLYTALGDDISNNFEALFLRGFVYRVKKYLKSKKSNVAFQNFARPCYDSGDLLLQLDQDPKVRYCLKHSSIITISIGMNNLIPESSKGFNDIDGRVARKGAEQFKADWISIMQFIRNNINSNALIYVMTLYNPYEADDPNYTIAEYYISIINSIIKSKMWTQVFNYKVVDVHEEFSLESHNKPACFNSAPVRSMLPNYRGYKKIAQIFINAMESLS